MTNPRKSRLKAALGITASLLIAGLAAWVLYRTFQRISIADVVEKMQQVPAHSLVVAACCAFGALFMLSLYEIVVVRYVKHHVGSWRAMLTALITFPIGHAVGQAMLSGGALRYRMYTPMGFSAMEVGATALLANLPYGLGFSLLLDLALFTHADAIAPLFRVSPTLIFALGCVGLVKDVGYLALVWFRKAPIKLGGWSVRLPPMRLTLLQFVIGLADVVLVSSVLYVLMPESAHLAYLPFMAVYLASVLAGVLSHVPAGLGVLESMLLLLLPEVPPAELLASVLLYRVIYEILPLLFSLTLWGSYELIADDGARNRIMRPMSALRAMARARAQRRRSGAGRPTIDMRE
ncbi:MAG: lysylphosphatidylglycerol synthase domain-containing protein [Steroidobacteraceae bacterium]